MKIRLFRNIVLICLLAGLLVPVSAADSKNSDEWQFEGDVYLWGASIDAKPDGGDNVHISFSDLLDNLDMAFMGGFVASKGKWSVVTDLIYLDVEDDQTGSARVLGHNIRTKVDIGLEAWIVTLAGGYTVMETDEFRLDILAGGRYTWIKLPLEFDIGALKEKTSPSEHIWDGIVGVRGDVVLADKWSIFYRADVGSGGSDLTKQGLLALEYEFDSFVASVGYRYMDYDLRNDLDDLTIKGPIAGVRYRF